MNKNKSTKKETPRRDFSKADRAIRNVMGQAILAAGSIGFVVQNLEAFANPTVARFSAAFVVGLVIFFANKR